MATVNVDVSEFRAFFQKMGKAASGDFKREMELFLEGLGNEFLRILQDEIVRRKVMDTRQLLASFEKGEQGNVWELSDGDLTLEVGTNVDYASYVNDGHWTNPKGVQYRLSRLLAGRWPLHLRPIRRGRHGAETALGRGQALLGKASLPHPRQDDARPAGRKAPNLA